MIRRRHVLALLASTWLGCTTGPAAFAAARAASGAQERADAAGRAGEADVLASLEALLEQARASAEAKDHPRAREQIAVAIDRALSELGEREDAAALALLERMGRFACEAGELRLAERVQRKVVEVRSRTAQEDQPDLQRARQNLATTLLVLRQFQEARTLLEQVLEVRSRTLPADHPDVQASKGNLARAINGLGAGQPRYTTRDWAAWVLTGEP